MKALKITILAALMAFTINLTANAQANEAINTLIANYLALKDALAKNDGTTAEGKAKILLASISNVSVKDLSSDQAAIWAKYGPKLEFDSRHISEVTLIPHQREHFASLSNNLYAVLKALKVNNSVLYRQYCSMTKRYFLSNTSSGIDPYMGMDNCSKVVETLPPAKK